MQGCMHTVSQYISIIDQAQKTIWAILAIYLIILFTLLLNPSNRPVTLMDQFFIDEHGSLRNSLNTSMMDAYHVIPRKANIYHSAHL